jgi:hypothetical protein
MQPEPSFSTAKKDLDSLIRNVLYGSLRTKASPKDEIVAPHDIILKLCDGNMETSSPGKRMVLTSATEFSGWSNEPGSYFLHEFYDHFAYCMIPVFRSSPDEIR